MVRVAGGSEWTLEDTIELKNINVSYPQVSIDMSYLTGLIDNLNMQHHHTLVSPTGNTPAVVTSGLVPSPSTLQSIKKSLTEIELNRKRNVIKQRHVVQLDWVSTEDGSHILTVGVGSRVVLYGAVCSELATTKSSTKSGGGSKPMTSRGMLERTKSMTVQTFAVEELRWMRIRSIELSTADGLAPLPMHVSWVRDGILVVGMDNEMHVYTQWRGGPSGGGFELQSGDKQLLPDDDKRILTDASLQKVASTSSLAFGKGFRPSPSTPMLTSSASTMSMFMDRKRKDSRGTTTSSGGGRDEANVGKSDSLNSFQMMMFDCGMFEAARFVTPLI